MNLRTLCAVALTLCYSATSNAQEDTSEELFTSAERLYAMNSFEDAKSQLDLAIALNKDGYYYKLRGECYQNLEDYKAAYSDYNAAVRKDVDEGQLYINRAICKIELGFFDDAIEDIYKFLETDPEDAMGYYLLGVVDYFNFNYEGAQEYLETAIGLDEDYMQAYYLLGAVYGETGKLDEALENYAWAYDLDPDFHRIMFNVGVLKLINNDPEGAMDILEPLAQLKELDFESELHYFIGEVHYSLRDVEGYTESWKIAAEMGDPDAKINYDRICLKKKGAKIQKNSRVIHVTL